MRRLAIGALSELAGVKVPTIRYYEGIGLLPAPSRTETNRRTYDDTTVRRLRFIRHARELGFEVDAIRTLLALADHPGLPCVEADVIAHRHLVDIDARIARLIALRAEIQATVDRCANGDIAQSRVIEVLAGHGEGP